MLRSVDDRVRALESHIYEESSFHGQMKADIDWLKKMMYVILSVSVASLLGSHLADFISIFHP